VFSKLDGRTHGRPNTGLTKPAYVLPAGGLRVIVNACGPPGTQDHAKDVVALSGYLGRQGDACVFIGGNCKEGGSLVGFEAAETCSVDIEERAHFFNNRVEDLFGWNAPGEERRDAPQRSLLGLDLNEKMRIIGLTIRCHAPTLVTTLTTHFDHQHSPERGTRDLRRHRPLRSISSMR
jgi:hypothetical protein